MPSDTDRSKWPTHRQSTPSIAAIASAFSHALRRLDLAEEGGALVGGGELVGDRARPVAVVRDLQRHAALARRMVFHRIDDVRAPRRRCRPSAASGPRRPCPGAGDVVIFLRGHADDRRQVGRLEVAERALDRLEAEAGMLDVEEHEVAAGRLQDVADAGRRELDDEVPELRRSSSSPWPCRPVPAMPFLPLSSSFGVRTFADEIVRRDRLLDDQRRACGIESRKVRRARVRVEGLRGRRRSRRGGCGRPRRSAPSRRNAGSPARRARGPGILVDQAAEGGLGARASSGSRR